ncbi:MAG: biotin--[acetyl-CoA-carboxylase] ligase [Acidimicrobiales bacterium]|uniref:biotin--[biotin carboxyl-carrier protein] ligase n=1 Tax=Candidatus Aeolococcus gillhamiae TaxID=3127015 RepID=A0A2W5ZN38_9BACT|nr:MAG: biotin--[acetyl-CoA-carboxylase] ligase [Candidatus Dormibacter sp. RRmetagenome_bin12]
MFLDERTASRLSERTRFGDVRHFAQIGSTNTYLREQAAAGAPEGTVAVADVQTAGRGRMDRTWESPPGSGLLVSVLLRPTDLAATRLHLVTAAAGLSARQAVEEVAGFTPELKWPNDLVVSGSKLAGILAESAGGAVVVGVGINLTWAPREGVALSDLSAAAVSREDLLVALLEALERRCGDWESVTEEYRSTCATVGRAVRVEMSGGDLEGVAEQIDADGRLVVRTGEGRLVAVAAGDVVHLRPEDGC